MRKRTKWIWITAGALLGLGLGILAAGTVIRGKIEKEFSDARLGDIRFSCKGVRVNLFRRSLTLNDVRLQTEKRDTPSDSLSAGSIEFLDAAVGKISLKNINLRSLLGGRFDFGTLSVDSPNAAIVTRRIPRDTLSADSVRKSPLEALLKVGFGKLQLRNGTLHWQRIIENDTLEYRINSLTIIANGLRVDSAAMNGKPAFTVRDFGGSAEAVRYTFANRAFILAVDSLAWNASGQLLTAANFELIPQYSKFDFPRRSARKSDYLQFDLKRLTLTGIDFDRLLNGLGLSADSLYAADGHLVSHKDRNAPVPRRIKPMIHSVIRDIPFPMEIRKIRLENTETTYEELAPYGVYAGVITFDGIDASVFGFTNVAVRPDQYIEIQAISRVNGMGELTAVISLPVDPENDRFEVKATLKNMPMHAFNRMLRPLARMEIESGHIPRLDFTMSGNPVEAQVDMIFRYNDLRIGLLKREDRQWQRRVGLSNLANWAVIRRNNPGEGALRTVRISVRRDPYRSSFNYLWKGVSAGALETAQTGTAKRIRNR